MHIRCKIRWFYPIIYPTFCPKCPTFYPLHRPTFLLFGHQKSVDALHWKHFSLDDTWALANAVHYGGNISATQGSSSHGSKKCTWIADKTEGGHLVQNVLSAIHIFFPRDCFSAYLMISSFLRWFLSPWVPEISPIWGTTWPIPITICRIRWEEHR